jgi:hypothetical protein
MSDARENATDGWSAAIPPPTFEAIVLEPISDSDPSLVRYTAASPAGEVLPAMVESVIRETPPEVYRPGVRVSVVTGSMRQES